MIQRIQTLYLLIVGILISQVFVFPFLTFFSKDKMVDFNALTISTGEYLFPLAILFGVIILIALVTIFCYKKRMLQARLTVVNTFLLLSSMGLTAYLAWEMSKSLSGYDIHYNFTCIFPLIAIVFNFLALRAIRKDEALVRSANRIR